MDVSGVRPNLAAREYAKVTDKKSSDKNVGTPEKASKPVSDSVEISTQGSLVSKVGSAEHTSRQEKVAGVKAEVAAGTYITAEKLNSAVDSAISGALEGL